MNSLNIWMSINIPNDTPDVVKIAKRSWYQTMALSVFLTGLKEPLGSMIRAMRPTDLATARTYCIKEQNIQYMKTKHEPIFKQYLKPPISQRLPVQPYNYNLYRPPIPMKNSYNSLLQRNQFSPFTPKPTYYNHRPFTHQNHNQISPFGNSKPLPPNPQIKAEPMDTTSYSRQFSQPTRQWHQPSQTQIPKYHFKTNGPPRVQVKELFNTELEPQYEHDDGRNYHESYQVEYPHEEQYSEDYYESYEQQQQTPDVKISDEDFLLEASEQHTDI